MKAQNGNRPADRQRQLTGLLLHRLHGVLERGVVQLHHVCVRQTRAVQPAGEVRVHDVEPPAPQPEVAGRHVHDHLVADLDQAREVRVGDRRPALPVDVDGQRGGRSVSIDRDHGAAPKREARHVL